MEERTLAKTTTPRRPSGVTVLSLKVTLKNTKPPIWRRILMPDSMSLADLHRAIQTTIGWEDCHLHDFDIGGERYGNPSATDDVAREDRMTLREVVKSGVTRFVYNYDFGDDWEHAILIEKKPPVNTSNIYPACVAGKRHCPPEDCGGAWGYTNLLEVLANPAHPEHQEQLEWLGEEFDPEAFSIEEADAALAAAFGRKEPPPS
jgi:Plasmid pRiA4b ORF-3-like protein